MEDSNKVGEQPKPKKKRVIPKLQIEESHAKPSEETEIQVIARDDPKVETKANEGQLGAGITKIKKKPESHLDGSVQSRTSVSTIPIQSNQINIEK